MELRFILVLLQTLLGGAAVTASNGQNSAADTLSRLSDMGRDKRSTSFAVESSTSGGLELSQCLSHRIEAIVSRTASGSVSGCQARPTVIALPAPQAWMVDRCSGSCINSHHTCVPTKTRKVKVPVMLSVRSAAPGPTVTECAETEVEEHVECGCGCHMTADQCDKDRGQQFLASECRCTCVDSEARDNCLRRGWFWNQDSCTCMCPNMPYPTCPSGYVFDMTETCKCKSTAGGSSAFIEFVVVLVSLASMAIVFTLIHCHKKKIGLFKERETEDEFRYRTSSFMVHVRTLSERLDSTASRIRIPSGNGVWDNGRTVKVVGISRINKNNRRGNAHHRGECCEEADELVQLHREESSGDVEGMAEVAEHPQQQDQLQLHKKPKQLNSNQRLGENQSATQAAMCQGTSRPRSSKNYTRQLAIQNSARETSPGDKSANISRPEQDLFLESDENVKPYRTFTV